MFTAFIYAQQDTNAKVSRVTEDGLHEIKLPNSIRSFSNKDLSDLRIIDNNGIEVPYFIRKKNRTISTNEFIAFDIISRTVVKDTSSTIIFKNPYSSIQEIIVSIGNYAGSKTFSISGSNDQQQWFGLINSTRLNNLHDSENTSINKRISLPLCSYSYLKIDFNDLNSLPINVLKIGASTNQISSQKLQNIKIKSKTIIEDRTEKKTQIHIVFEHKEYLNQVEFKIASPVLFNRSASIYKISSREAQNKTDRYKEYLARFHLNSNTDNIFDLSELFENNIYIDIENNDNSPLVFDGLRFLQEPIYIIADLKANENYHIKTGDKNMKAPHYDITYFKNTISTILPQAKITNVLRNGKSQKENQTQSFWQKPLFMWLSIALAGIAIIYITSSLVKDLKKN
jgi:hypothetical protein